MHETFLGHKFLCTSKGVEKMRKTVGNVFLFCSPLRQ